MKKVFAQYNKFTIGDYAEISVNGWTITNNINNKSFTLTKSDKMSIDLAWKQIEADITMPSFYIGELYDVANRSQEKPNVLLLELDLWDNWSMSLVQHSPNHQSKTIVGQIGKAQENLSAKDKAIYLVNKAEEIAKRIKNGYSLYIEFTYIDTHKTFLELRTTKD